MPDLMLALNEQVKELAMAGLPSRNPERGGAERTPTALATFQLPAHLTSVGNACTVAPRALQAQQGGWHESEARPLRQRAHSSGVLRGLRPGRFNSAWCFGLLRIEAGNRDPRVRANEPMPHGAPTSAAKDAQENSPGARQSMPLLRPDFRVELSARKALVQSCIGVGSSGSMVPQREQRC